MVPDLLIHSTRADRYYSFTSEIIKALAVATNPSKKRKWLSGDPAVVFEGDIILVYIDEKLEDLSLVTDSIRTCQADLIIECREQKGWYESEGLGKIKLHYDKYKPRLGTYIITLEKIPEQVHTELVLENVLVETASERNMDRDSKQECEQCSSQIHLLNAGFDQSRLEPIIDSLVYC